MGERIDRLEFEAGDHIRFRERLETCLECLEDLLDRPGFGVGPRSLGAELELYLVDEQGEPAPRNLEVLEVLGDPRVTPEINRYNLELNADPIAIEGRPFTATQDQLDRAIVDIDGAAASVGARITPIGILPTLRAQHLGPPMMTDENRYRVLARALREARGEPFQLQIAGLEALERVIDDVTAEGAATSFQIHLRVNPGEFASVYNAVQLATAPLLACAGNSPLFLEHLLWEETRIALFKQAVDCRPPKKRRELPARVTFGDRWVERGPYELFRQEVDFFAPLIPLVSDDDPKDLLAQGVIPTLSELRLHHGTVWRWNRPVYDAASGGHLRIEIRSLPAGPSVRDMMANAAFAVGLAFGLAPSAETLCQMPFPEAERNFYRAAQHGLHAELRWPVDGAIRAISARELIVELLPLARRGLVDAGIDEEEADEQLALIRARVASGQTGSRWQRESLRALEQTRDRGAALAALVNAYRRHVATGEPVHTWPVSEGAP